MTGIPTPRASDSYERRNRKTMIRIRDEGGDMSLATWGKVVAPGAPMADSATGPAEDIASGATTNWGPYADAIHRWEQTLGRPAPSPTDKRGLSPAFVEWLMGLPEGWVTDLELSRTAELKMLGNGVVPQQALLALQVLTNDA